jgi:hypothetical protein
VYGNPPTNALGMRYILAGSTSAVAYTVLTPDTATATGQLVAAMQKNAGTYTTWGSATPFTNAGFSGYWRAARAHATVAYDSISLWESQEACMVQLAQASTGSTSINGFGALFDPIGSTANQAESDGRLYSMFTSGSLSVTSSTIFNTSGDGSSFGQHVGSVNGSHAGFFTPGANTIRTSARFGAFTPTNTLTTADSEPVGIPLAITDTVTGNFRGASRQWYVTKDLSAVCAANPDIATLKVPQRVHDEAGVDIVDGRAIVVWAEEYSEGLRVDGSLVVRFFA